MPDGGGALALITGPRARRLVSISSQREEGQMEEVR